MNDEVRSPMNMVLGPDAVSSILASRGQVVVGYSTDDEILVPLRSPRVLSGEEYGKYYGLWSNIRFRRFVRRLALADGAPVPLEELDRFAVGRALEYTTFLSTLNDAVSVDEVGVSLTRRVKGSGADLEWYVAEVCQRELSGSAMWAVRLADLPVGGDFDVLAWLPPSLVYIELKTTRPSKIGGDELRNFLQRSVELAPDLAILMVDTDSDLGELMSKLEEVMRSTEPTRPPDKPFFRLQREYGDIYYGYFRVYVTNAKPSILTQLQRCLRHYNARVKGVFRLSGPRVNFVTGEVDEDV